MRRKLTVGLSAIAMALAVALPAAAAPPAGVGGEGVPDGIECQQRGIGTVLELHRTQPELFQTGGVSVLVPGVGEVAATWCDGI